VEMMKMLVGKTLLTGVCDNRIVSEMNVDVGFYFIYYFEELHCNSFVYLGLSKISGERWID
jgi:hypothetical protein